MKCLTCQGVIVASDVRSGCRRCVACRTSSPGRVVTRAADVKFNAAVPKFQRPHTRGGDASWRGNGFSKPAKAQMPTHESWWTFPDLVSDRQAFMAKALAESEIRKVRIHGLALNELITL